jgi:hypothetical protein
MKSSFLTKTLVTIIAIASFGQWNEVQAQTRVMYSCIQHQGKSKTVASTNRGRIELIVWESSYFSGAGWTPQKRCQEITQRFQKFSDNGTLQYVTTGKLNGYPVICTGTRTTKGYQCRPDGLLITLQNNDNPAQVLRNLFSNATRKGGNAVVRSIDNNYVVPIQSVLDQAPTLDDTPETPNSNNQLPNNRPPLVSTNPNPLPDKTTTNNNIDTTNSENNPESTTTNNQTPINKPPVVSANPNPLPTQTSSSRKYSCVQNEGKPMTVVDTGRGRIQLISWESSYFSQSSWTPQKRCDEVTKRFQQFSDNGTLKFITTGKIDKYNVICVSGQKPAPGSNISCSSEGLLITLEPKDDPDKVMKELFQEATRVGSMPIRRSQRILDMEKYLSDAPIMNQESVVTPKTSVNVESQPEKKPEQSDVIDCPPILCD